MSGVDSFGAGAIRGETRPAVGVARQTTGAIGTESAAGALAVGTLATERAVIAHVFTFTHVGAADLILRAGATALIVGNAGSLARLTSGRTRTGSLLTRLSAQAAGGALTGLTGLAIATGSAVRNRPAGALLA